MTLIHTLLLLIVAILIYGGWSILNLLHKLREENEEMSQGIDELTQAVSEADAAQAAAFAQLSDTLTTEIAQINAKLDAADPEDPAKVQFLIGHIRESTRKQTEAVAAFDATIAAIVPDTPPVEPPIEPAPEQPADGNPTGTAPAEPVAEFPSEPPAEG